MKWSRDREIMSTSANKDFEVEKRGVFKWALKWESFSPICAST